jgi:hypothetical protein
VECLSEPRVALFERRFLPSSGSTAATSSKSSEELIEQLKQQLAGPLFAAVSDQFSHLQNSVVAYQNKLQYAELKIRVLEERLRLVRIAKYGPGSEKLSDAQLELLELEPGVSSGRSRPRASARRSSRLRKRSASIRDGRNCPEPFRVQSGS